MATVADGGAHQRRGREREIAAELADIIAFGLALAAPVLVWSSTRPRSDSWLGNAELFAEVFVTVAVAAILTRYAAMPALQWLSVRMP